MAAHAQLYCGRWRFLRPAHCDAVRYSERGSVHVGPTAGTHQPQIYKRLPGGEEGRQHRQHGAAAGSDRCRAVLCGGLARVRAQHDRATGGRRTAPFARSQCARPCPSEHGHQRLPGYVVRDEVPLRLLASRNGDSGGGYGWQRRNLPRYQLRTVEFSPPVFRAIPQTTRAGATVGPRCCSASMGPGAIPSR
jgi:hypothetical protein